MKYVAFHGPIGSGKSTLANQCAEALRKQRPTAVRHLAEPLKEEIEHAIAPLLGEEKARRAVWGSQAAKAEPHGELGGRSARDILKARGSQCRELFGEDYYLKCLAHTNVFGDGCSVMVDDARYRNELRWFRQRGGLVIGLERGFSKHDQGAHPSDELHYQMCHHVIDNRHMSVPEAVETAMSFIRLWLWDSGEGL